MKLSALGHGLFMPRFRSIPFALSRPILVLWILAVGPGHALAQSEATLLLKGHIAPRCESTFDGVRDATLESMDLSREGSVRIRVEMDCNTPFSGTIRSENGALVSEGSGPDGDLGRIVYKASLDFPGLGRIGPFVSEDMKNAQDFDSGQQVLFETEGELEIRWDGASRGYAGVYEDRLFMTVTPRQ